MVEIGGDGTIMRTLSKIFSSTLVFSLLLMGVFVPLRAQAGFFSAILGDEVYADTRPPDGQMENTLGVQSNKNTEKNSQNMALLQANVSSAPILKDKKTDKNGQKDEVLEFEDNGNINIESDNALVPSVSPLEAIGISPDTDFSSSDQISVYLVRKGDSISQIAEMFDVSVNTILLANDLKKGQKLVSGDVLFILPISGAEHTIAKGQTLKSIAKIYKVDADDIALYNGLAGDSKLSVGDKLMIPGGDSMDDEGGDKSAPNLSSSVAKDINYYLKNPIQNLFGYFINPVPTGHKTQGLHGPGHRGIDIGAPTGTPIYASAAGRVLAAKTGCKVDQRRCGGGYGNLVIVEHPNGTKTLSAHMSRLATRIGAQVAQGEIIGYVGNTGKSTGPHIHFEVFYAKNPGADWSWATNQIANN